jgi:pimeloyl-ACP methyl ester carboxylesterase
VPTLEANGITIYYEIHGEGDPLLIILGLANDLTEVEGIVHGLSQNHRVIAFDNRGAGRTDKPDMKYSIETMAEDTAGLLGGLSIRQLNVLGISMGGRIALSLALAHPELVRTLILASTSASGTYRRGLLWSLSNLLVRIPMVREIGTRYPQPYYAYVRQREASRDYDATGRLREIQAPTLILHGKKDRFAPYPLAEEIHAGIRGSRIVTFDGGHLFMFSKQKEFISSIEEFLEAQTAQPS